MKIKTLDIIGNKPETVDISDKILKSKVNNKLIKQVVDWQLNHLKARTAKTKQRKAVVAQGMLVEKHLYLLEEVLLMALKGTTTRSKRLTKKLENSL